MFKFIKENKVLMLILVNVFVDLLGFTIIIPLLTDIIRNPNSLLIAKSVTDSDRNIILGWLTGVFALGVFVSTPILGDLSDKYGRKPMLFISLLGTFISRIVFVYSVMTGNLILAFIARIIDGLTGGNISIASAALSDISAPENRAKLFGYFGMTFGFGFIIGPALGAAVAKITLIPGIDPVLSPMLIATALSLITLILNQTIFPETIKSKNDKVKLDIKKPISHIIKSLKDVDLRILLLGIFLFNFGFNAFTTFIGNYWNIQFGWSQQDIGIRFAIIGIVLFLSQGFASAKNLYAKKEPIDWLVLVTPIVAIATLTYGLPSIIADRNLATMLVYISVIFTPIANTFVIPNLNAVISRKAGHDKQGEILGLASSVTALAQAIPPIIAGYLSNVSSVMPIIVAFVFIIFSSIVFKAEKKAYKI